VHPGGEDAVDVEVGGEAQQPVPKSRKARKYVDRKAPKANFLLKVCMCALVRCAATPCGCTAAAARDSPAAQCC
jgi:hypothetical protein